MDGAPLTTPAEPFAHVFAPLELRGHRLRSRITFGAHTTNMAELGLPGDRHLGYYRERALGGAGMIVVEPVPVHPTAVLTRGNFRVDDDAVIDGFRRITDACHEVAAGDGGVVMIQQLYHVGQHGDADNSFAPNWSPSGLASYHDADGSHTVTATEIGELLDGYVRAARRARSAGFDGVEIFAAYHALVDQFWTPWSNRRDDEWGGSFENRMRFSRVLLERVRSTCGDDFVVGLAVSIDPASPAALSVDAMQEIVAWHDARMLIDYVTCGTGSYFDFHPIIPTSLYPARLGEPHAAALKDAVRHALVQAESHIRTPEAAEAVLAAGHGDLVSIVRGQIADPHLVAKARSGRGGAIRPCISCNQLCWGRRSRDYWISCLVNPSAGREHEWGGDRPSVSHAVAPRDAARSIVVVGGGPAGLETARVAAERGHRVTLVEAANELGGQWRLAARQPSRSQIGDHLAWYARELARLGVDVRLGVEADLDTVLAMAGDVVVLATGAAPARRGFQRARPMSDSLPGIGDALAQGVAGAIDDVLDGTVRPRGRVLVLDDLGDWRGIGTAIHLQESGCATVIASAAPVIAGGLFHSAADVPARARFVRAGGEMWTSTTVSAWRSCDTAEQGAPGGVARRCANAWAAELASSLTGATRIEPFNFLVVAETPEPRTALSSALTDAGIAHHLIGDAVAARRASLAIYEGRRLAQEL